VSALAQNQPAFTQQQLDQMLAPIALYPDPLLSQVLMASTYPLEVVEAARWSKAHPGLEGDDAVRAVAQQSWDPSVKSLVAFPQVLAWMDESLDWTSNLGDAFLAQETQVMETVQTLRQRAQAAGALRSDDRNRIVSEAGAIAVVPASPQIIYVPYYDPLVVYGPWWWPAYPPVHWRPWPDYYARPGYAAGYYWGPGIRISAGFLLRRRRLASPACSRGERQQLLLQHGDREPAERRQRAGSTRGPRAGHLAARSFAPQRNSLSRSRATKTIRRLENGTRGTAARRAAGRRSSRGCPPRPRPA